MTKNVTNLPGGTNPLVRPRSDRSARADAPSSTKKPTVADKLKDKKSADRADRVERRPQAQRPQRAQRAHGAGHGAGAVPGAEAHDDDAMAGGAGATAAIGETDAGELHRRRHGDADLIWETPDEHVEEVHELHDSAASTVDSVKRSKNQQGSSDGFEGGQQQREAYERLLKGNVKNDHERFAELRKKGVRDDFKPDRPPPDVEKLGVQRTAAHLVRMYDHWTLAGLSRADAVQSAATWLSQLSSVNNIRKVLQELESKPIRDVYPLEILMHLLEQRPDVLPGVKRGAVLGNVDDLAGGRKVLAGVGVQVPIPADTRLKSFALLGGARPGYEFFPTPGDERHYTLLIDTPGRWTFSLLAVPMQSLGRIQKEGSEAILELFQVTVSAMGRKGEPISPEDWWKQEQARLDAEREGDAGDDDDASLDGDDLGGVAAAAPARAEPAPLLILQIRKALDTITKDDDASARATTYSWDCTLHKPGAPLGIGEPILHLVVDKAGPFDPVWARAREALAHKQREYEPGRALVTTEDIQSAIRRARVRS